MTRPFKGGTNGDESMHEASFILLVSMTSRLTTDKPSIAHYASNGCKAAKTEPSCKPTSSFVSS